MVNIIHYSTPVLIGAIGVIGSSLNEELGVVPYRYNGEMSGNYADQ